MYDKGYMVSVGRGKTTARGGRWCSVSSSSEAKNDRKWERKNREETIHGHPNRNQEIQARHI